MPQGNMNKPRRTGLSRIFWATHYSYRGIKSAWKNEAAFRQELCLMLLMLPAACWLGTTTEQRLLLIAPCLIVVIVELLNSAIEAAIDRIGPEMHELSGQAKDIASAAVFFALCLVIISWGMIAWDRFAGA
jgi:diacylglycerol kinase (ATP)